MRKAAAAGEEGSSAELVAAHLGGVGGWGQGLGEVLRDLGVRA